MSGSTMPSLTVSAAASGLTAGAHVPGIDLTTAAAVSAKLIAQGNFDREDPFQPSGLRGNSTAPRMRPMHSQTLPNPNADSAQSMPSDMHDTFPGRTIGIVAPSVTAAAEAAAAAAYASLYDAFEFEFHVPQTLIPETPGSHPPRSGIVSISTPRDYGFILPRPSTPIPQSTRPLPTILSNTTRNEIISRGGPGINIWSRRVPTGTASKKKRAPMKLNTPPNKRPAKCSSRKTPEAQRECR